MKLPSPMEDALVGTRRDIGWLFNSLGTFFFPKGGSLVVIPKSVKSMLTYWFVFIYSDSLTHSPHMN